jgi:hypothetical protein
VTFYVKEMTHYACRSLLDCMVFNTCLLIKGRVPSVRKVEEPFLLEATSTEMHGETRWLGFQECRGKPVKKNGEPIGSPLRYTWLGVDWRYLMDCFRLLMRKTPAMASTSIARAAPHSFIEGTFVFCR